MLCLILSQYTKWNLFKYGINTLCISNARKKAIRPNHVATKMKEETKQNATVIADLGKQTGWREKRLFYCLLPSISNEDTAVQI